MFLPSVMMNYIQGHVHCPRQISDPCLSSHSRESHLVDDEREDEGHLHEGRPVTPGQETARDGEATEGEDDTFCDATKGF